MIKGHFEREKLTAGLKDRLHARSVALVGTIRRPTYLLLPVRSVPGRLQSHGVFCSRRGCSSKEFCRDIGYLSVLLSYSTASCQPDLLAVLG
jgi:hypothetical protein